MIYDCFTFYNELELLEVRLHELSKVVDKFVIVEAPRTFTNKPKPLCFLENRARFSEFDRQIIHIQVSDSPNSSDPWAVETFQRNCIARGLVQCQQDDLVLISDVDEIPRAEAVRRACQEYSYPHGIWADFLARPVIRAFSAWEFSRGRVRRNHPFVLKFEQSSHRHFINCVIVNPPERVHWYGTRMLHYRDLKSPQDARHSGYKVIKNGGWHFTSMGGVERIREKIGSFSHQEFNNQDFLNPTRINEIINQGMSVFDAQEKLSCVKIDDSYPRYIRDNPQKFGDWIKSV
jgi:beta-1,4-mannosyl-glycoprotein beta-1,4-N-acetylglucosaminyltransferase